MNNIGTSSASRIGILITARLGSSRLPRKALLEIAGKPAISHLISRAKYNSESYGRIILCTTDRDEDNELCRLAEREKIEFYRGDKADIIKRQYQCASEKGLDVIINLDGDDILADTEYVPQLLEILNTEADVDVARTASLPFGMNIMGYRTSVLQKVLERNERRQRETGWGQLICDSATFHVRVIPVKEQERILARVTLDYKEDYIFFKKVIGTLGKENHDKYISHKEIVEYLKNNQEVIGINISVEKKYWDNFRVMKQKERHDINE